MSPIGPRSVYDEAKRFTEAVTMAYHRYYKKVDTNIVRVVNTYGPGMQLNVGPRDSPFHETGPARGRSDGPRRREPGSQLLLTELIFLLRSDRDLVSVILCQQNAPTQPELVSILH